MTLVGATGHQHLPAEFIPTIVHEVRSRLSLLEPSLTGVCSLAAGADQLFAEQVLSLGGNLRVIVPSQGYESTFEEGDLEHYRQLLNGPRPLRSFSSLRPRKLHSWVRVSG